jgi:hypothetical protein
MLNRRLLSRVLLVELLAASLPPVEVEELDFDVDDLEDALRSFARSGPLLDESRALLAAARALAVEEPVEPVDA